MSLPVGRLARGASPREARDSRWLGLAPRLVSVLQYAGPESHARGTRGRAGLSRVADEPRHADVLPDGAPGPRHPSRPPTARPRGREGRGRHGTGGAAPGGQALRHARRERVDPAQSHDLSGGPHGWRPRGAAARRTPRRVRHARARVAARRTPAASEVSPPPRPAPAAAAPLW